jgi:hypothetical protein
MNKKGITPLIILLIIGGVLAIAGGGYILSESRSPSDSTNSDLGTTSQGLENSSEDPEGTGVEIYEDVKAELAEVKRLTDYVNAHQNDIYTEEQQEQDLATVQDRVKAQAQTILAKSFCQATLDDVKAVLQTAVNAQKAGLGDLSDQLMDWAKNGFTSHTAEVAHTWTNDYSDSILYDWAYHAELAGLLGLENLFDMIINGHIDLSNWLSQNCGTIKDPIIGSPPDTLISNTLSQNFCKADLNTIKEALKVMALAQKLGRSRDAELWVWVQNGFKAIVAKNYESWSDLEKTQHAAIAQKLGLGDLSDQLTSNTVDLKDWYNNTCTTNGPFSVTFDDATLTRKDGPMTMIITVTGARAYTCKGLYSDWHGKMTAKMTMTNMMHQQQTVFDKTSGFAFTLTEPNPAKPRTTGTRLEGNRVIYWLANGGWYTGNDEISGAVVRGASECSTN